MVEPVRDIHVCQRADINLLGEDEVALSMLLATMIVAAFIAALLSAMVRNALWGGV